MANDVEPYRASKPGDLWTAELWNETQQDIRADIGKRIDAAIKAIERVGQAGNSDKLENQTADELTASILQKVRQELPTLTGYRKLFKRLEPGKETLIEHKLGTFPLVDLYRLRKFRAVCSEDDQRTAEDVYFYIYHSSERRMRFTPEGGGATETIDIEMTDPSFEAPFRIPFADLLSQYRVQYTDTSTLEDLETEFWDAFFADPNDRFDDADACHSPWVDRCCGERRTVRDLKQRGDWDEIWLKLLPEKTVNLFRQANLVEAGGGAKPADITVYQHSFNVLGLTYTPQPRNDVVQPSEDERLLVLLKV
ncbi:MAG TPA: hypothetical protein VG148_10490 [Pyrinomonadaceae bacterium]|nr:hypothetical protein [Pyrinomonadaceae bacterium]